MRHTLSNVADVDTVRCRGGEVPLEQVGHLLVRRFWDGGRDPSSTAVADNAVLTHHPGHPLVVDPLVHGDAIVEFCGDPGCSVGVVLGMDRPDSFGQLRVGRGASGPVRLGGLPGVVGRTLELDELAQPLHLIGVGVVGDELEAGHQFVSPAKYLAALRRISRSVVSLVASARRAAFSASRRASFCSTVSDSLPVPGLGLWGRAGVCTRVPSTWVLVPVPYWSIQPVKVPRTTPRSAAIPRIVAPGVDSYNSTAWRRNSSE